MRTSRCVVVTPAQPIEPRQIRNFLVLQYESPLGSVVHATPLYEALKRAMPDWAYHRCRISHGGKRSRTQPNYRPLHRYIEPIRRVCGECAGGAKACWKPCQRVRAASSRPSAINGRGWRWVSLLAGAWGAGWLYPGPKALRRAAYFSIQNVGKSRAMPILSRASAKAMLRFVSHVVFFTQQDAGTCDPMAGTSYRKAGHGPRIAFVTQNSGGQRNQWSPVLSAGNFRPIARSGRDAGFCWNGEGHRGHRRAAPEACRVQEFPWRGKLP